MEYNKALVEAVSALKHGSTVTPKATPPMRKAADTITTPPSPAAKQKPVRKNPVMYDNVTADDMRTVISKILDIKPTQQKDTTSRCDNALRLIRQALKIVRGGNKATIFAKDSFMASLLGDGWGGYGNLLFINASKTDLWRTFRDLYQASEEGAPLSQDGKAIQRLPKTLATFHSGLNLALASRTDADEFREQMQSFKAGASDEEASQILDRLCDPKGIREKHAKRPDPVVGATASVPRPEA